MLSKKMEDALNKQVNAELWSAYLYLAMSAYFKNKNLNGFANWMRVQYQEETTHALKIFDFINERGGNAKLEAIAKVEQTWKDPITIFEVTLAHEKKVTSLINNLVDISLQEKDHATGNMLQWFVAEQVEEEANAEEILQQLKMINGKGEGLFMIDKELKLRVFVDSTKPQTQA